MHDPSSSQFCLDQNPVRVPRMLARAYLWLVGAGALLGVLVFAVASQSSLDAERIAGSGGTYAATLVSAMAVAQGRRLP